MKKAELLPLIISKIFSFFFFFLFSTNFILPSYLFLSLDYEALQKRESTLYGKIFSKGGGGFFFFFCSAQILFYLPTCFFLWTMKPSKRESPLSMEKFSPRGGGGGGGGGGINYCC